MRNCLFLSRRHPKSKIELKKKNEGKQTIEIEKKNMVGRECVCVRLYVDYAPQPLCRRWRDGSNQAARDWKPGEVRVHRRTRANLAVDTFPLPSDPQNLNRITPMSVSLQAPNTLMHCKDIKHREDIQAFLCPKNSLKQSETYLLSP